MEGQVGSSAVKDEQWPYSPWSVSHVDEFLYYCCPECEHRCKERHVFFDHAYNCHPTAQVQLPYAADTFVKDETGCFGQQPADDANLGIKTENISDLCDDDITSLNDNDDDLVSDDGGGGHKGEAMDLDDDATVYQCYICADTLVSLQAVRSHVKSVHRRSGPSYFGPPRSDCPKCNEKLQPGHVCKKAGLLAKKSKIKKDEDDLKIIQCYVCGDQFNTRPSVKQHQRENHKRTYKSTYGPVRTLQCESCKYMFADQRAMDMHVCNFIDKCFREGEAITCHKCNRTFKLIESYRYHLATFHEERKFSCSDCEFKAVTMRALTNHRRLKHIKDFDHVCDACGKGFLYKCHLVAHKERLCPSKPKQDHVCEICGKHFSSLSTLGSHKYDNHHPIYMCTLCDKVLNTKILVAQHIIADHSIKCDVNKLFLCVKCDEMLGSAKELDHHYAEGHGQDKSFECCDCPEAFHSKATLKLHLLRNHVSVSSNYGPRNTNSTAWKIILDSKPTLSFYGKDKKGLNCDVCERTFSCPGSLMEHKRQVHDKSNHIKCDYCDYSSFQPSMLRTHFKRIHDKSNTYECEQCSFTCHYKPLLGKHIRRVHEKVKTYKCDVCGEGFLSSNARKRHLWKAHNVVVKK